MSSPAAPAASARIAPHDHRRRALWPSGEPLGRNCFDSKRFHEGEPLEGLGTPLPEFRKFLSLDPLAVDAFDRATQRPDGGANNPYGRAGKPVDDGITGNNVPSDKPHIGRPEGNSRQKAHRRLRKGMRGLDDSLASVPADVKAIIKERMWERRWCEVKNHEYRLRSFEEFVTAPPFRGLGTTMDTLVKLCRDDPEALDLLDQVTTARPGNPHPSGHNQYSTGETRTPGVNTDNVSNYQTRKEQHGNSMTYGLRRLRAERPDLHDKVLSMRLTANQAMVAAGFRRPSASVFTDKPEDVADFVRRHFSPEEGRAIAERLLAAAAAGQWQPPEKPKGRPRQTPDQDEGALQVG